MVAGTIHEQQDELPGVLLGQCLEENLEAFRIGRRQDQISCKPLVGSNPVYLAVSGQRPGAQ
jgi:hypothetical protein